MLPVEVKRERAETWLCLCFIIFIVVLNLETSALLEAKTASLREVYGGVRSSGFRTNCVTF